MAGNEIHFAQAEPPAPPGTAVAKPSGLLPALWPTPRQRLDWAWRQTPEFHNWRRAVAEGGLVFVLSLLVLRGLLDPQGWGDELLVTATSLVVGSIPGLLRLFWNFIRAPRRIVEQQFAATWYDLVALQSERDRLLGDRINVEIRGILPRPARLKDATDKNDGIVYALQNTIITNRSDENVSLSFELWLPTDSGESWLMMEEHEHSGLGREDPRYARSPINIGPRTSSECRDIGFLWLPGRGSVFDRETEFDLEKAVLRIVDRISKKTVDVLVRRRPTFSKPPGVP